MNWIIRHLGLKGSFFWACKQMKKGLIVKPKNITGAVKYRFDKEDQQRLQWAFIRDLNTANWENAYFFYKDVMSTNWEIWQPPQEEG